MTGLGGNITWTWKGEELMNPFYPHALGGSASNFDNILFTDKASSE